MNYKSQLKAWGIDRALEFHKAGGTEGLTLDILTATSDALVAYSYDAAEDVQSMGRDFVNLIRNAPKGAVDFDEVRAAIELAYEERLRLGLEDSKPEVTQ